MQIDVKFEAGQMVRVKHGRLAGHMCEVKEIRCTALTYYIVRTGMLGTMFPVEIEFHGDDLEAADIAPE
jgi:transcription antitermination factor NusG